MINFDLYYVDAEVKGSKNNKVISRKEGAFVNCYTYAKSEHEAMKKVKKCLTEDNYEIINIEHSYAVDESDFKEEEDLEHGEPTQQNLRDLKKDGDVYFAYFHTYPLVDISEK